MERRQPLENGGGRKMEGEKIHFEGKIDPADLIFVGSIEIPRWSYESFDYFGVSFNRGVIDKVCFFQYNIVREIAIFCVACLVTDRPHFFGK